LIDHGLRQALGELLNQLIRLHEDLPDDFHKLFHCDSRLVSKTMYDFGVVTVMCAVIRISELRNVQTVAVH